MNSKTKPLAVLLAAMLAAALPAACGSDTTSSTIKAGNATDVAFITDMVPHHQGAIAMAEEARSRAEHPQIRTMANNIISAQQSEIDTLNQLGGDLHQQGVRGGHMGMSSKDMGMNSDLSMLHTAKLFDRLFIDMMIPHHQGAIRMARQQLAKGENAQLRKIAKAIIAAQTKEIAQMRAWRAKWYGSTKAGTSSSTMSDGSTMMGGQ